MIVVTGGAGFIGSTFIAKLNAEGLKNIIVVDDLGESEKWKNLRGKEFVDYFHKAEFRELLVARALPFKVEALVHMGACSSTTEANVDYLLENNYKYTKDLLEYALEKDIRFIYASSAATYGAGEFGYSDQVELTKLCPLNPYGYSKHIFDLHLGRLGFPGKVAGLKFFNVFGPNEYHKGEMKSVVFKSWRQIKENGRVQLFKSYRSDFADGEQKRDFVYVKDCTDILWWLLNNEKVKGLFNIGSGKARSWNDLVRAVFAALGREPWVDYVDMPENMRNQYQYYTQAEMAKLEAAGYPLKFGELEDTIKDYVSNYLETWQWHF